MLRKYDPWIGKDTFFSVAYNSQRQHRQAFHRENSDRHGPHPRHSQLHYWNLERMKPFSSHPELS